MYRVSYGLLLVVMLSAAPGTLYGAPPGKTSRGLVKPSSRRAGPAARARPPRAASQKGVRRRVSRGPATVTFQSGDSLEVATPPRGREHEYRDLTRSGNPLLKTGGRNRFKKLTADIRVGEYARSGEKAFDYARIDKEHLGCLQAIRNYVGKPVKIISGYRSNKHNTQVYSRRRRKPTLSQHTGGRASDIRIPGMTGLEIGEAAIDACGPNVAIGLARTFAHIDGRGAPKSWVYDVPTRQLARLDRRRRENQMAHRGGGRKARKGRASGRVTD